MTALITAIGAALVAVISIFLNRKDAKDEKKQEVRRAPDTPVNEYMDAKRRMQELERACPCSKPPESEDNLHGTPSRRVD
jgi:hypothetical protein